MFEAIKTIHDEYIIHFNSKPPKFMLDKGKLKIIDFGLAKSI